MRYVIQMRALHVVLKTVYQNAAEVIALAVMNLACAILGALEVIDGKRWLKTLTDIKVKHSIPIITTPIQTAYYVEIALSICVGLYAILFAYLSYAVVREFGWVIYKKIGADLAIQRKLEKPWHYTLIPIDSAL